MFALFPGDYNQNNKIDAGDYVLWADPNEAVQYVDGSRNGVTGDNEPNAADYHVWTSHFGDILDVIAFGVGSGDYNGDGKTDALDWQAWRRSYGNPVESYTGADGSGNGLVSTEDYVVWATWDGTSGAWADTDCKLIEKMAVADSTTAPRIVNVTISGSNSTHDPYSFATHVGSGEQLGTVPVGGADTISITFSEDVNIEASFLQVVGLVTGNAPTIVAFSYDATTKTAVWRFANLQANDFYVLSLSDAVTDHQGHRLDGEWVNPATLSTTSSLVSQFPSGDGHAGGDFNFVFTLLAGDTDLSNDVSFYDYQLFIVHYLNGSGLRFTDGDFDGNGLVNFADFQFLFNNYGLNLQSVWMLGDLNGDHVVNDTDAAIAINNLGMSDADWSDGDLNGDGRVTPSDVDLLLAQYGRGFAITS